MDDIFDTKKSDIIKHLPYRLRNKIRDNYYEVKYFFQRIFIGHDDFQVFEMYTHLAHHTLPLLVQFRKNCQGYPVTFSLFEDNCGLDQVAYDKAIEDGELLGGGQEAWFAILDEMIFAFQYTIVEDSNPRNRKEKKMAKLFKEEHGDVWAEKEENKKDSSYHLYNDEDGNILHVPCSDWIVADHDAYLNKGYEYGGIKNSPSFHHDDDLEKKLRERCDKGLELFGKWYKSLWL